MGTIVEVCHDEKGIIWPESVAPFKYHIVPVISKDDTKTSEILGAALKIYDQATSHGGALIDDRAAVSVGSKFADADLLGLPVRIVVSEKTLEKGGVEVKKRSDTETNIVNPENLF
jgi:prolyl-tRNA synthetase